MNVSNVDSQHAFAILSKRIGSSGRSYQQIKQDYLETSARTPESVKMYADTVQRNNEQLFGVLAADMFALQRRIEQLESQQ